MEYAPSAKDTGRLGVPSPVSQHVVPAAAAVAGLVHLTVPLESTTSTCVAVVSSLDMHTVVRSPATTGSPRFAPFIVMPSIVR